MLPSIISRSFLVTWVLHYGWILVFEESSEEFPGEA
jgi:hypothetical protein